MHAVTIYVILVVVTLRFCMAKIAMYRSTADVVTLGRLVTGLPTTVYVVWNCFHKLENTE